MWVLLTVAFSLGSAGLACYLILPSRAKTLFVQNCHDVRGRLRLRYCGEEILALGHCYSGLLLFGVLFAVVGTLLLAVFDEYVMSLDVAAACLSSYELDPERWMENMKSSPSGNAIQDHYRDRMLHGVNASRTRRIQELMWTVFPFASVGGLLVVISCLQWTGRRYQRQINDWAQAAMARRHRRQFMN